MLLFVCVSFLPKVSFAAQRCSDAAIIVLGTRPLDENTLSLDMIRRVEKAVELYAKYPAAAMIFTGGKTAGKVSEAQMMAQYAASRGIPAGSLILEEDARSTLENAKYTAALLNPCVLKKTILITRHGHLKRAVLAFSKYRVFGMIQPAASRISKEEIIQNLQEYLAHHKSVEVQGILDKVIRE